MQVGKSLWQPENRVAHYHLRTMPLAKGGKESDRFGDGVRAVRAYPRFSPPHKFRVASFQNMNERVSRATQKQGWCVLLLGTFTQHVEHQRTSDVRGALEETTIHVVERKSSCAKRWNGKSMCRKIDRNDSMLGSQHVMPPGLAFPAIKLEKRQPEDLEATLARCFEINRNGPDRSKADGHASI